MSNIHNLSTSEKIVLIFLENNGKDFTIRELAKSVKVDYKSVYISVDNLHKAGVLEKRKVGNSSLCKLGKNFNSALFKVENHRKDEALKNSDLKIIYNEIRKKIQTPFYICLLFGSYAKGKATKKSDIDIIVVAEDKDAIEKEFNSIIQTTPLPIHMLTFTKKEFVDNFSKGNTVVNEAIEKNIILYGIEAYYRLLGYD